MVHRSNIATDAQVFALQLLRNQIGHRVYPAHRLDRKTGGVLLFSLNKNTDSKTQQMFATGSVSKAYLAVVRGFTNEDGVIEYPLKRENGTTQDAVTNYKTLMTAEINLPSGKHTTSRYSLVRVNPVTGRMHQIRRHFAHIFHPVIGDRPHGCNKQNRIFKEKHNMTTMMLHAHTIKFHHPITRSEICIEAKPGTEFRRVCKIMNWETTKIFT